MLQQLVWSKKCLFRYSQLQSKLVQVFLCGKQPNQTKSKDWEPREGNRKTTKRECEKNQRGVCLFMSGL